MSRQPLFTAGRIRANIDFTQAGYDLTVADYRRIVLTAVFLLKALGGDWEGQNVVMAQ